MAGIEVKWDKMGSEFTYTVMYSKSEDGPWLPAHYYRLTDDIVDWFVVYLEEIEEDLASAPYILSDENVFVINGLRNDEQYFVKVLSHDKYNQWWYSYKSEDSIEGGYNNETSPSLNGGNSVGFQFELVL